MLTPAASVWPTSTQVVDQVIRWGSQSSERAVLVIIVGLVALVLGLIASRFLVPALVRGVVRGGIWVVATARAVIADGLGRWRVSRSGTDPAPTREYLRLRPTSAEYDPETLVSALEGLHSQHHDTELGPALGSPPDGPIEVMAATQGADAGIEFYIGGDVSLSRLAGTLPYQRCGFDVERVQTHPARLLASTDDDTPPWAPVTERASIDGDAIPSDVPTDAIPAGQEVVSDGAGMRGPSPDATAPTAVTADAPARGAAGEHAEPPADDDRDDGGADRSTAAGEELTDVLLARWADEGRAPVVFRLHTTGTRNQDWMMPGAGLRELVTAPADGPTAAGAVHSGSHPLMPILRTLADLEVPALYHVTFRSFRSWEHQADRRQERLKSHSDTIGQRVSNWLVGAIMGPDRSGAHTNRSHGRSRFGPRSGSGSRSHTTSRSHGYAASHGMHGPRTARRMTRGNWKRFDHLNDADTHTTFVANVRLVALPDEEYSRAAVAETLRTLWADLDHLEGDYYRLAPPPSSLGDRLTDLLGIRGARHRQRFRRLCRRRIVTPLLGHTSHNRRRRWPDLVCSADELAAWTAIPSTAALPDAVTEHLPHRPAHTDPREGLPPAIRDRYVGPDAPGVRLGYLLTDDGGPALDEPVNVPVGDQQHHALELGASGTGKSTDVAGRASQYPDETRGPTIIVTGPGANIGRYTMRALAARSGFDWLEEHVHWFPVPSVIPGVAPLNLESVRARDDVDERWDAVTEVRDQLVAILRRTMGGEAYDDAQWSKRVIHRCIEAAFDPEYWAQNAGLPSRPGPDACQFAHVRAVLDQLAEAGQSEDVSPPKLSTDEDQTFERVLNFSDPVFGNIIGGAYGRLDAIADDHRRRLLFASTDPEFTFAEILDSDDVYIFDLSALQDEPQQLMALTLVTLLNNALKEADSRGWLRAQPEDYLVNLVIDEAAFVAGSEYFTQLLAEGRNYRIGLDLATQYLQQFADEVGGGAMRNVIANTDTKLVGTHVPSDRLAEVLQPAALNVTEVRQLVRDLPEAHRVALLPRQTETERPQLLTVHRGPLPAWHPESNATPFDEQVFEATLDRIREQTQAEYGVAEDVRRRVYEGGELTAGGAPGRGNGGDVDVADGADRPLDHVMAEAIRAVQLQQDVRESNEWVPVEPVDETVVARLADDALDERGYEVLPRVREASDLVEVDLRTSGDAHTVVTRLTAEGEAAADPDTGEGQFSGGEAHDDALRAIEGALTDCGFSVHIITQNGEQTPDAIATHPDISPTFSIEAETTTHRRPAKVLANLRKAQAAKHIPLFVVTATDEGLSSRDVAQRVANILAEPVKQRSDGDTLFYTQDAPIMVDEGDGGEELYAARPATGDNRETRWVRRNGTFVCESADGTEYVRVSSVGDLSNDEVPAVYRHEEADDTYTVITAGELPTTYESRDAFVADWVPIKRPFVPAIDLPEPEYTSRSYAIAMLDDQGSESVATVYDGPDGAPRPVEVLLDDVKAGALRPAGADNVVANGAPGDPPHAERDSQYGIGAFVEAHVTTAADGVVPVGTVYDAYEAFATSNDYEVEAQTHFTQALKEHVDVASARKYLDGEMRRCYTGIDLVDDPPAS